MSVAHDSTSEHDWIAPLSQAMGHEGYCLIHAERGCSFDDGVGVFSNGTDEIEVVRDRGQWMVRGRREDLGAHGLFRAYDDDGSFVDALRHWIQVKNANQKAC